MDKQSTRYNSNRRRSLYGCEAYTWPLRPSSGLGGHSTDGSIVTSTRVVAGSFLECLLCGLGRAIDTPIDFGVIQPTHKLGVRLTVGLLGVLPIRSWWIQCYRFSTLWVLSDHIGFHNFKFAKCTICKKGRFNFPHGLRLGIWNDLINLGSGSV
ncbi:hypothetical protein L218DRAFT_943875 [Marasmius fiardii PR-910]|nr:hypothetical protein L218DRAFT_943875 [Marasmius fiardii PR-910]